MDSHYDLIRDKFEGKEHRAYIGGLWDELGSMQLSFMRSQGLLPHHKLLDIGCGSLRGGVKFIEYLEPKHYFGHDINPHLIKKGRDLELNDELRSKVSDDNFTHNANFIPEFPVNAFDYGIAFSLFTHMPIERVKECLTSLRPKFFNGQFFATFFVVEEPQFDTEVGQKMGIITKPNDDPYHYTLKMLERVANETGWKFQFIGDFGHPRNQQMVKFSA